MSQRHPGKYRKHAVVEATYDAMWGIGVPLHMKDSVNEIKWTLQGLQGKMLTKIRSELKY